MRKPCAELATAPSETPASGRVFTPAHATPRAYFVTRWTWLVRILREVPAPEAIAIFHRSGLVPAYYARHVQRQAAAMHTRVGFIGGLDPSDLTTYVTLRSGGVGGAPADLRALLEYRGVDDAWLALCDHASDVRDVRLPLHRMTDDERENWDHLTRLDVDWGALLGPRCLDVLRSGWKLDLDEAAAVDTYGAPFVEALRRRLFDARPARDVLAT